MLKALSHTAQGFVFFGATFSVRFEGGIVPHVRLSGVFCFADARS